MESTESTQNSWGWKLPIYCSYTSVQKHGLHEPDTAHDLGKGVARFVSENVERLSASD